jgi:DNA-binding IclR family transcriptional regulator
MNQSSKPRPNRRAGEPPAGAGIKSVEKAGQILQALGDADGPLRLVDLAERVGMPRSMAHGYLVSLLRTGLVKQDASTGLYDLGETTLQLGLVALARVDFLKLGREAVAELSQSVGETVLLSVWSEKGPIVVAKVESRHDSVFEVRIGSVVRLTTATGHVFMAFLPRREWEPVRAAGVDGAPLDEAEIQRIVAEVRTSGVAHAQVIRIPNFVAVAAPVFDHEGSVKATLTIVGQPEGMNVPELKRVCDNLSRKLGRRG